MLAMENPIYDPEFAAGDRVLVQYCDDAGEPRYVLAEVASDAVVDGDSIAVVARREVFDLIGHSDHPVCAALAAGLPDGHRVGLVLVDECEPARPSLRLVVDNTKDS
jgi:hypothetical protein